MILNISEAVNIAIHALVFLASRKDEEPVSTGQVANSMGVSEAHLSKVFQRLTKVDLVRPVRGPRGGFLIARDPGSIKLLDIYEAIDGPKLQADQCMLGGSRCDRSRCVFGNLLTSVTRQVEEHFSRTSLADLIEDSGKFWSTAREAAGKA